jgi:hypothetical protein
MLAVCGICFKITTAVTISGVIGAIDGSHITIKSPKNNSAAYINRKGQHSIVLQAG